MVKHNAVANAFGAMQAEVSGGIQDFLLVWQIWSFDEWYSLSLSLSLSETLSLSLNAVARLVTFISNENGRLRAFSFFVGVLSGMNSEECTEYGK